MKLAWDKTGERLYETGVDKGVLYPFSKESEKMRLVLHGTDLVQ